MDAEQILATGGMGGATGVIVFILYKLLRQGLRSKCCGQTIEVGLQTPKTIQVKVDEAHHHPSEHSESINQPRPSGSSVGQDKGRASSQGSSSTQGDSRTDANFERENPLLISIPKSSQ